MEQLNSFSVFKLSGPSMSPYLVEGDHVLVEKRQRTPEPGSVVLLEHANQYVAHRILSNGLTKGDCLRSFDKSEFRFIGVASARLTPKGMRSLKTKFFGSLINWLAMASTRHGLYGSICFHLLQVFLKHLRTLETIL